MRCVQTLVQLAFEREVISLILVYEEISTASKRQTSPHEILSHKVTGPFSAGARNGA
jgi:hypothetical protein